LDDEVIVMDNGAVIALACDHGGFELMSEIKAYLGDRGLKFADFGTYSSDRCDYPDFARRATDAIISGQCAAGILVCGTGVGMSIAANRVPGIRAALCGDCYTAELTRRHNDANVLALGGRVLGSGLALKIVETFLDTGFEGGRHGERIAMLDANRSAADTGLRVNSTSSAEQVWPVAMTKM
jgi:ribose 5-phosphate isomerase B